MTFLHFVRRLHLYLGLSLMSWFIMYGLSSAVFAHPSWFNPNSPAGRPPTTPRFDRPYEIAIPPGADLRPIGARIMADSDLKGAFGVYRPNPAQLDVYVHTFWAATEVRYLVNEKRLVAEDRRFRFSQLLTGMHARGGFEQDSLLDTLWGVMVDVVSVAFLLWIATGIYQWWQLPSCRLWGWLALGVGCALFATFMLGL